MTIFKDKKFIDLVGLTELEMEILNKNAERGFYHLVQPRLDELRYRVNEVNSKLSDNDKKMYYNKLISRRLEGIKNALEKNNFQQPDIYDVYELLSHVNSFI